MWYIHTTEKYLAIKRNEIVMRATLVNLKNILYTK